MRTVHALLQAAWGAAAALPAAFTLLGAQQVVELPARDRPFQPALEEVYRVGKIDGALWELYGGRVEVAFDGAGNLHVFDPDNHRVVVVSPQGTLLREVGRRGDGPGELRTPMGFAVMRDGTVVIADMGQRAFLVFGADGEHRHSVSFGTDGGAVLGTLLADPRGGAVISSGRSVVIMTGAGPGGSLPGMSGGRPIVRYGLEADGEARELHRAWEPPPAEAPPVAVGGRGMMGAATRARAFEPRLLTGVLPDGAMVVSDSSGYALKVLGSDGRVQRILRRAIPARPVTPQMERAERARRLAELSAGGGPRVSIVASGPGGAPAPVPQGDIEAMLRSQIEALQFYPELPVVSALAAGWTGTIWVGRSGQEPGGAPGPVDVLTSAGEYLGTIAAGGPGVPSAFGPEGLVAWVERDALDVATVAVRRLPAELR